MQSMKIIIIPARGGSKGIPKKNLRKVGGVPLVSRAIAACLDSCADLVVVSTDDNEILAEVKQQRIVSHKRSVESSSDYATSESVISEVIRDLGVDWQPSDLIGIMQVTSPFTTPEQINQCFAVASKGFTGFTAVRSHKLIWRETPEGWRSINHPQNYRIRRQDMPMEVFETGAFYAFSLDTFLVSGYRFCAPAYPVLTDEVTSIDIDSQQDLEMAELISRQLNNLSELNEKS